MSRCALFSLLAAWTAAPVYAALDPETKKPYTVQVVLQTGAHPVFTKLYEDRLRRGLEDGLRAALGKLGQVEAVDREILLRQVNAKDKLGKGRRAVRERALALLEEVERHGLQEALDSWKEVSETKTHFVLVDFTDGQYVVRARQFDGLTGMASPVVREARTNDHEFVLRLASFLVNLDFGFVGSLEPASKLTGDDPEVQMILKGGELSPSLTPWVRKGEVFAVSQIQQAGKEQRAMRVLETFLQVLEEPKGAACRCRVLHRFEDPLPLGGRIAGYRCLKLGTTRELLHLRLVNTQGLPLAGQRFEVSPTNYGADPKHEGATNEDGFTPAPLGPYDHVALVRVLSGMKVLAQFPVPILDDRPVVRSLDIDPTVAKLGHFEFDKKYLVKRLDQSLLAVTGLVEELDQISKSKKWEEALAKAHAGLKTLRADLDNYNADMDKLRMAPAPLHMTPVQERLQILKQREAKIKDFIAKVEKAVTEEKDPRRRRLRQMAEVAQLKESEAEFDEAIDLYKKVLREGENQPALRPYADHLAKLEKDWAPKNDAQKLARLFIYKTWPGLKSAADLKAQIGEARKALQACVEAGDRMTPLKLIKSNTAHATALTKRLDTVLSSTDAETRKEGQTIVEVSTELEKLTTEATSFVRSGKETAGKTP
jgi:hypothetical protein